MARNTSEEILVEEWHSPRKAIVFDGAPETTLDDYFQSLSKSIHPVNVTHASQIRGDRVCMFFREEDHINQLLKEGGLDVKNTFASCHRFHVEPSKVILSNCLPFISNRKLADTLSQIGKIASPIIDVPVNTQLDNFKHVKSFRKTVDILFDDMQNVPYKVMVEYRTKSVPIYICVENLLCAECQCYGHCAASCPTREVSVSEKESPEVAELKRPRAKSAPSKSKRASSPITSFFCRHAAHLSWEPGFTSSIDFSRESVWSPVNPKVACTDDVPYEPSDSDENTLKDEFSTGSVKKSDEVDDVKGKTDSCTLLTFPPMISDSRPRTEERPFSADCSKRRAPLRKLKLR